MKSLADALGLESSTPTDDKTPKTLTVKAMSKALLHSREYAESLRRRIMADELPAAVECRLYDYAFGKPIERVEVKDTSERLEDLTSEELEAKAMALAALAAKLRADDTREADDVAPESNAVH